MIRIAIASKGKGRHSRIDEHFGRAPYFVLVDSDTGRFSVCGNSDGRNTPYTAGMQTAGTLLSLGVKAVIAAKIGSKALTTLRAAGVPVYRCRDTTVEETLKHFKRGVLSAMQEADACEVEPPDSFHRNQTKDISAAAAGKGRRASSGP